MFEKAILFYHALTEWRVWFKLSSTDLTARYRATYLGPLWVSLGTGIGMSGLGFAWGVIMGMDLKEFFPYMVAGYISWLMWSEFLTTGCSTFQGTATTIIKNIPMNIFVHPLRLTSRIMATFSHNLLVFVLVALICRSTEFSPWILMFIPGMILTFFLGTCVTTISGMVAARYPDWQIAIGSLLIFIFLTSPIMWYASGPGRQALVAMMNPMTHLIEIVRSPLLGEPPSLLSWIICLIIAILAFISTMWLSKTRGHRLPYWL